MIWYSNVYADEECQKNLKMLKWRLEHGTVSSKLYLVTISTADKMQLDILDSRQLMQEDLRKTLPMIVGIACSHGSAVDLVIKITEEVYRETGTCEVRHYLEGR